MTPPKNYGWCVTGLIMEAQTRVQLLELLAASDDASVDGKLLVLPETDEYTLEKARGEWLALLGGGDGPWSTELLLRSDVAETPAGLPVGESNSRAATSATPQATNEGKQVEQRDVYREGGLPGKRRISSFFSSLRKRL